MPDHTPGPWTMEYTADEYDSHRSDLRIIDPRTVNHPQGPVTLAKINVCAFAPHMSEPLANAHLIAAAPELLEALKWALEQIADDLDPDHQEALQNAQAVVQRAGGYL